MHQKEPCLIIPDNDEPGKLRLLNANNLAKIFARIDKSITLIFFDACREDLDTDEHKDLFKNAIQDDEVYKFASNKATPSFPGFSAILYSCKEW